VEIALLGLSTLGWILVVALLAVAFVLWIYCLFDVVVRGDMGGGAKIVWALALVLLAPLAILAYLVFGRARR
jgi:hypothetical protein